MRIYIVLDLSLTPTEKHPLSLQFEPPALDLSLLYYLPIKDARFIRLTNHTRVAPAYYSFLYSAISYLSGLYKSYADFSF